MSDLLSEEERSALQAPYAGSIARTREVVRAEFPSVSQLDPERAVALVTALKRWLVPVSDDLSRALRVPCTARPPHLQMVGRPLLPLAEDEATWGSLQEHPESHILISLPRSFAAALCERLFGAPFE